MKKIKLEELTDSEKMMVNYLLNNMVQTLIIDGKEYKKEELKIVK